MKIRQIPYRQFDHTGDLGLEVEGTTLRVLFENAGRALFDLLCDLERVRSPYLQNSPITTCQKGLQVSRNKKASTPLRGNHWEQLASNYPSSSCVGFTSP